MESALYGIFTLVGFVSEISLVRCAHSFDFRYFRNSCENPVRTRFPWSNLYRLNWGGRSNYGRFVYSVHLIQNFVTDLKENNQKTKYCIKLILNSNCWGNGKTTLKTWRLKFDNELFQSLLAHGIVFSIFISFKPQPKYDLHLLYYFRTIF